MQYRIMPKTNDKLSVLGFGCMRLPTVAGGENSGLIDRKKALELLWGAIDKGVNYLDTAYPYHMGASESFLGEHVLKNGYREKVKVATKLPTFLVKRQEDMMKFFERQRKKLNLEQIDYYLLHALNGQTWERLLTFDVMEFMDFLKREGKISRIGFSFHGTPEDFRKIIDSYAWDFCQVQLNILDEFYQAGINGVRYAASKGIGVIIMEPLRGGTLVNNIPKEIKKIWDSAPVRRTPADWALRWLWNNPDIQVVLSGMSSPEQVDENVRSAEDSLPGSLSPEELGIIQKVKDKYHELLRVRCTGCRYCMPCPAGIDIPYAFQALNSYYLTRKKIGVKVHYMNSIVGRKNQPWTSACLNCGNCESKCPQQIRIREEFKKVRKVLEGADVKFLAGAAKLVTGQKH